MSKNPSKTIGIDARFYGEAGPGRYAKAIIQHLEKIDTVNSYKIFLRKKGFEMYEPSNPNFEKILAHYSWYSFEEQIVFLVQLLKYRLNLLYVPHFNVPILYPKKLITAIPDIIMHEFSTDKATTRSKLIHTLKKYAYYIVVFTAVIRSKKIIVPSNAVKNDFIKYYKYISKDKYVLAYEGVDPDYLKQAEVEPAVVLKKYNISKPFLLYVGSMYRHKNVKSLIGMFKILVEKYNFDGQLVVAGKNDFFSNELYSYIKNEHLESKIIMPGIINYVSDADIIALRKTAEVYVFPSLKEGFSLTPMEGMALGLPAVISDIPCHKEVYKDSVIYFNPHDELDIAEKVNLLLANRELRDTYVKKGYDLIGQYNWKSTAQITLDVFKKYL